ncbi:MAG: hypothetical protein ACI8P3_003095 [Saprospiraceae bacterium]|jgi:hypothetical protein
MLDKIMEMVGGDAISALTEKAGISMDQAKEVLPLAGESLQEGLMSQVTGGNIDGVLGMFKSFTGGGLESNGIFESIKNMFMKKVMTSMGLPESVAGLVAGTGMSSIIGSLAGKMTEHGDTDEIDAGSLMGVLGGDGGGMLGNITDMLGGNSGGGVVDSLKDAAMGKLGDIAGGFFGK